VLSRTDWFWWGLISLCAFKPGSLVLRTSFLQILQIFPPGLDVSSLWYITIGLGNTPLQHTQSLLFSRRWLVLGIYLLFSLRFDNSWFKDPRASFCLLVHRFLHLCSVGQVSRPQHSTLGVCGTPFLVVLVVSWFHFGRLMRPSTV